MKGEMKRISLATKEKKNINNERNRSKRNTMTKANDEKASIKGLSGSSVKKTPV